MVQINHSLKEVTCKIVYYGPGMAGKTTNLEMIHKKAPKEATGELISIATEGDRTLFFDFLPLDLGRVADMNTKFQLYTVPGQTFYNSTRKLVLQGVDGIIFVADSKKGKMQENIESLKNMAENLEELGTSLQEIPLVLQYNKRDLPEVMNVELMNRKLNPLKVPWFESVAVTGTGVFPALKKLSIMVLEKLNGEDSKSPSTLSEEEPPSSPPEALEDLAEAPPEKPAAEKELLKEESPVKEPAHNFEEVLKLLLDGQTIEGLEIPLLDISNREFHKPFTLKNGKIGCLRARNSTFHEDFKISSTEIESIEMGDSNLAQEEESEKGSSTSPAHFIKKCSLTDVTLGKKADFKSVLFEGKVTLQGLEAASDEVPLSFYNGHFKEGLLIQSCQLGNMDVRDGVFEGKFEITNSQFKGDVNGWKARFLDKVEVENSQFKGKCRFRQVVFEGSSSFRKIDFHKEGFFGESTFKKESAFFESKFIGEAHFHEAHFGDDLNFSEVECLGNTIWNDMTFKGKVYAKKSKLGNFQMEHSTCLDLVDFTESKFNNSKFSFSIFKDVAYFRNVIFQERCDLSSVRFEQRVSFRGSEFQKDLILLDMDALNVIIGWNQVEGKLKNEEEGQFAKAASEYSILKNIFESRNQYEEMDEAYLHYKRMERKAIKISLFSPFQLMRRGAGYVALDLTNGYGTKPLRILMVTLVLSLLFGIGYSFFPGEFSYSGQERPSPQFTLSNAIYFSVATFTTMGFGDWTPHSKSFFRFVVILEAFLGIFTMSLFVAAFTRKIIR